MKNKAAKILSYVLVALVSCALTLGCALVFSRSQYSKLDQLQDLIGDRFVGEVDEGAIADAAAQAMVGALGDRWSHYMTAQEYQSYKEQMANAYVGIGVTVQLHPDGIGVEILEVTAGGGADEAGVQAGDIITAVDEEDITQMEIADVRYMIRGDEGTDVTLTLKRGQQTLTLEVERKSIQTPVATGQLLQGNIGLVRIVNFDSRCCQETLAVIEQLRSQGAQKLIFDVRFNPGGYKNELVKLLDHLLPEGLLFRSEYYNGTVSDDRSDSSCLEMPMAVLVNGDSYSAAEFFAAALRDYDWATVVGTQTCGKGYFQNTYPLSDGSAVTISVGKYYTPNGVSLAEVGGLTPDKIVEVTAEQAAAIYAGDLDPMDDPQILAAIELLQ